MKILFCNFEYPPLGGGGGVINALLAEEMAKRNDVTVLTSRGPGLPAERVENGVRVMRVPVFFRRQEAVANLSSMLAFIPMGIREGKRRMAVERYDVINTHFVLPTGPVGDALSRSVHVPNVLSLHGGDLYDPSRIISPHQNPLLLLWIRRLLRRADAVIGQSENTLRNMRHYYTPEIEGNLIPLGIRQPNWDPAPRSKYGLREDEVVLVTIGRLVARKAVDQMISLMAALRKTSVRLLIIGAGPQGADLKSLAREMGLEGTVRFLDQVEETEKFRILQMSDLYVSTSQHEGFGLVFLEAMACGLPIVCYDHGGQTDFLKNEVNGFLVPLNDQERFLNQCRILASNPGLRKGMAGTNQKAVVDYYINRCAARYEQVFTEVCQRRTGTQPAVI